MDPPSISASIIAVGTRATQCAKAFAALRAACKNLPGRLHAINNEVADISAVLADVAALMSERGRLSALEDECARIAHVMAGLNVKLAELESIVDALAVSCARSKILLVQARAWSKVQSKLFSLQDEIKTAKMRLVVLLGASNWYALRVT